MSGPARRSERAGLALIALGLAAILWGVLFMTTSSLGGPVPERSFAKRRSYDMVKRSAHQAFPGFALRAGGGFVLLLLGAHLRQRKQP